MFPKLPHRERLFLLDLSDKLFTVVVIIGIELLLRIGEVVEKPQAKMPFPIRNLIQT